MTNFVYSSPWNLYRGVAETFQEGLGPTFLILIRRHLVVATWKKKLCRIENVSLFSPHQVATITLGYFRISQNCSKINDNIHCSVFFWKKVNYQHFMQALISVESLSPCWNTKRCSMAWVHSSSDFLSATNWKSPPAETCSTRPWFLLLGSTLIRKLRRIKQRVGIFQDSSAYLVKVWKNRLYESDKMKF